MKITVPIGANVNARVDFPSSRSMLRASLQVVVGRKARFVSYDILDSQGLAADIPRAPRRRARLYTKPVLKTCSKQGQNVLRYLSQRTEDEHRERKGWISFFILKNFTYGTVWYFIWRKSCGARVAYSTLCD